MKDPSLASPKLQGWRYSFRAFRHRNFRLYWSGQVISQAGTWMQTIALSWLVYRLTDSPWMLGLVSFAALLPVAPLSLLAGAISDRFSRRNLILVTEIVLATQAIILAVLIWMDSIQIWHIMVMSFIMGAAAAVEQPARLALIAETVGRDDLPSAIALNSAVYNSARIVGPAIAGIIVAWIGEAGCFFLNGISFFAVILALLAMRLPERVLSKEKFGVASSIFQGLNFIWKDKTILGLMTTVALSSFFTLPYLTMLPAFAKDILLTGPQGLGLLMTGVGLGAILGSIFVANLHVGRRGNWLTLGNILGPAFILVFCLSKNFTLSLILVVLVGASNAVRQTLANSLIQILTPDEFHGRVMSIFNLLFNGMSRVGSLGVGGLAEFTGVPLAVGASATISFVLALVVVLTFPDVMKAS